SASSRSARPIKSGFALPLPAHEMTGTASKRRLTKPENFPSLLLLSAAAREAMKRPRPSPYAQHSRWSAPGPLGERGFDTLPAAPAQLPAVVSGLVLHPQEAALRGIAIPDASRGDAHLRSVGEFLQ